MSRGWSIIWYVPATRHPYLAPEHYLGAEVLRQLIDLKEVIVANGTAILMMFLLLRIRRKNRESTHDMDRLCDSMCIANLLGAAAETVSFLIDGQLFPGARILAYFSNSLCFLGTVSIGLLWCPYVEMRIYRNYRHAAHVARLVAIPWFIEVIAIIYNLFGTGFLFSISEGNVYSRGPGAPIGYISLLFYFSYSVYLVYHSKKEGINLHFFPVQYFIGPCLAGVVIQFLFYGITTSWISVAIALVFVQMQTYAENLYKDQLSGLFNRRYLGGLLEKRTGGSDPLCGIMLDVNDFKNINDTFGHSAGDRAICVMGDVLFKSIPDGAIPIRFAGDEFIVLLPSADEELARQTVDVIHRELVKFSESGAEPFKLSVCAGYTNFGPDDNAETFLKRVDDRMYEAKRQFHLAEQ